MPTEPRPVPLRPSPAGELLAAIELHAEPLRRLRLDGEHAQLAALDRYYRADCELVEFQDVVGRCLQLIGALAPAYSELNSEFVAVCARAWEIDERAPSRQAIAAPVREALQHCAYFMTMLVRFAEELGAEPPRRGYGWRAMLILCGPSRELANR